MPRDHWFVEKAAMIVGEEFLKHRPPSGHPESPERVRVIMEGLRGRVKTVKPRPAEQGELTLVHEEEYVSLIRSYSELGTSGQLDPDTFVSEGTWISAIHAVGAAIQASLLAYTGAYEVVFAAARPPGHHAYPARAAGFCVFNNIAIAVARMLWQGLASRIAVVDVDAHYGDGTAHIFYGDPRVLYISLHGDPRENYPWRGFPEELGSGEGRGFNVPIPLPPGSGDEEFMEALRSIVIPLIEDYGPDLLMVSAGFDTHHGDPLMDFNVTVQGHWEMMHLLYEAARRFSGRGLAAVLEGGYNLASLPLSTANLLSAHMEKPLFVERAPRKPSSASRRLGEYLGRARRTLRRYWAL